jgi:CubicO group peptidase (beta-lactamase class C family)
MIDGAKVPTIFERNFHERGDLGASCSVWQDGREVISLAGGFCDREQTRPWTADTLIPVWSATKGPAAAATLLACEMAGLRPETPVTGIWPELRAGQSGRLTVAGLLSHQSGLAALPPESRPDMLDREAVVEALAAAEPAWEPGTAHGYHPRTMGFLLDEVVRRVSGGISLGRFWRERIAIPAGLDFWIGGLPEDVLPRLARIYPPKLQRPTEEEIPFYRALGSPNSLSLAAFSSPGGMRVLTDINDLRYLQAGLPALGGVGTARALAGFYAMVAGGGALDGKQILPPEVVIALGSRLVNGDDQVLMLPTSFSAGCMMDPISPDGLKRRQHFGPSLSAFGQPGAGGSHAFADPEHGISFAYTMNQMESGVLPNRKSLDLVKALYDSLTP